VILLLSYYASANTFITKDDGYWSDPNIWTYNIAPPFNPTGDTIIIKHCVKFDSVINFNNCKFLLDTLSSLCGHKRLNFSNTRFDAMPWTSFKCDTFYFYNGSVGATYYPVQIIIQFQGMFWGTGTSFNASGASLAVGPNFWCSCTLDVPKITPTPVLSLFPNPVEDQLNISFLSGYEAEFIEILDRTGRVVKTILSESTVQKTDCSDLAAGFYLLLAYNRGACYTTKFVKK